MNLPSSLPFLFMQNESRTQLRLPVAGLVRTPEGSSYHPSGNLRITLPLPLLASFSRDEGWWLNRGAGVAAFPLGGEGGGGSWYSRGPGGGGRGLRWVVVFPSFWGVSSARGNTTTPAPWFSRPPSSLLIHSSGINMASICGSMVFVPILGKGMRLSTFE